MIDPNLDLKDRDAHYNGCWYALWGTTRKEKVEQVKDVVARKRPNDQRWTQICLMAIDQYYSNLSKPSLFSRFGRKK